MYYEILDVPQSENCEKCIPCLRLRLMEIGFIQGQRIEIKDERLGLYIVNILSDSGDVSQTIVLRPEELNRICLKEKI